MKKNIKIQRATTFKLTIVFKKDDGTYENLDGWQFYFTVKKVTDLNKSDEVSLIKKNFNGSNTQAYLELTPNETDIDAKAYFYDIKYKKPNNEEQILAYGNFVVANNATRRA